MIQWREEFFKMVLFFHSGFDAMEIKREEGGIRLKEGGSNARIEVWVKATESKKCHEAVDGDAMEGVGEAVDFRHVGCHGVGCGEFQGSKIGDSEKVLLNSVRVKGLYKLCKHGKSIMLDGWVIRKNCPVLEGNLVDNLGK